MSHSYVFTYDQIIQAARQTAIEEANRQALRDQQAALLAETIALNPPLSRHAIESLSVGDFLSQTFDTDGRRTVRPGARWGNPREVVEIVYRGVSDKGMAYVGGYCRFGPARREDGTVNTSTISFSIGEGEADYRITSGE